MLLTVSTTHTPATDLGFLLHKHPDRVQTFPQAFGTATVFYPEASEDRCTAALILEIDPVRLARTRGRTSADFSLAQYVNDRPYAASSLLGAAMAGVFSTARSGRCRSHQDLADSAIPLVIGIPALPCRGGPEIAERVFGPLGWAVEAIAVPLDEAFPEWGDSRYVRLRLTGTLRLADALSQLYVLLPVLDESKHYWQGPDEVDKLLRSGTGWLADHPDRELITRRYLGRSRQLAAEALERLVELSGEVAEEAESEEGALRPTLRPAPGSAVLAQGSEEQGVLAQGAEGGAALRPALASSLAQGPGGQEALRPAPGSAVLAQGTEGQEALRPAPGSAVLAQGTGEQGVLAQGADEKGVLAQGSDAPPVPLNRLRHEAVLAAIVDLGATSVIDLGCGPGALLTELITVRGLQRIAGCDVSTQALRIAARRLKVDRMHERQSERIELFQGALTYEDPRFAGYDAAVLMEVIEHVDPPRLSALERVVFGIARPGAVLVTTPNQQYNERYEGLTGMRHADHRFEWTRSEFAEWAGRVADDHGYRVEHRGIGEVDATVGTPTQFAIFTRTDSTGSV